MAYEYYCMGCGKLLNQETVLFDMQYLLTSDASKRFNILQFRMTQPELKALIASGSPVEAGYKSCKLTLSEIMRFISNGNNLNDPAIAALTITEIGEYMKQDMAPAASGGGLGASSPFGFAMSDDMEEEEDLSEDAAAPYVTPASIQALESKDQANTDRVFTRSALKADFEVLQRLFDGEDSVFTFEIKEENDIDNENAPVLVGYNLHLPSIGYLCLEARVCPKCGTPVFKHAGTAKHQAIAFIGYQAAGKTSTILALAHYAGNYMITGFGSQIWDGKQMIDSVATVEPLDEATELVADLENYGKGIAPGKTLATKRADAYSATFRIKNKSQNRHYLITLTDLPGELCLENGTIDRPRVLNNFPVALSCDAFVACFDTQSISASTGGVVNKVMNVCRWTDEFQKMRASHNQVETYVPTMLLFTKCQDLEDPNAPAFKPKTLLPLEQMYCLRDEKQLIARNNLYKFVCDQFDQFGQLKRAYHSMMRCSPFGYKAPSENDLKNGAQPQSPTPRNIDRLMRWVLSVSGCIPTEASYALNPAAVPFKLHDFCISRPQLRNQNPGCDNDKRYGNIDDIQESMARCALFENPGRYDKEMVGRHDQKARLVMTRMDSKMHPNTNDKE